MTVPLSESREPAPPDVDVVVVGAGACGLLSALQLAEGGLSVALVDRHPVGGANTSLSSGMIYAAGTRYQRDRGIADSPEQMAADIRAKNGDRVDVGVLNALCEVSARVVHWLADRGGYELELADDVKRYGQSFPRAHADPQRRGGEWLVRTLLARARSDDRVMLVENASFVDLVAEGRRVVGADIEISGQRETVRAGRAVLLACGGFGADRQMVQQYCPDGAGLEYIGSPDTDGAGILAATRLGAARKYMSAFQGHGFYQPETGARLSPGVVVEGGICVAQDGRRFVGENMGYSEMAIEIARNEPPWAVAVFNAETLAATKNVEIMQDALEIRAIREFESLAELAAFYSIDEASLRNTVETYNDVPQGEIDVLGRVRVGGLLEAPFYAGKIIGSLAHTQGGLVVDADARVLESKGHSLAGLYAGGGCAAGVSGDSYTGYSPGNGLLSALGLGALAARHILSGGAAEEATR